MATPKIASTVLAVLVLGQATRCDTVTLRDHHLSRNGRVVSLSAGTLTLEARYGSSVTVHQLRIEDVEKIDFNGVVNNNVGPGNPFGVGPSREGADKPKSEKLSTWGGDLIIFKREHARRCALLSIDADLVRCQGERDGIPRGDVLRVLLGVGK